MNIPYPFIPRSNIGPSTEPEAMVYNPGEWIGKDKNSHN